MTDNCSRRHGLARVEMASDAAAAAAQLVKGRARFYGRRPMALEPLYPGRGSACATTLIAIASHLVEQEARSPRRWFGFGGEVNLVNARAALLLGRALRRFEGAVHERGASAK